MKKLLNLSLILSLLIIIISCVTEKKRAEICNTCPVMESVVYKEKIKLKDTTIYITQHGPIQYLENPCKKLCDSLGNLKPFSITKKENGIVGTIKSVGNSIAFDCKDDSLKKVISGLIEKNTVNSEEKTVIRYENCKKNHRTDFDGFCRWFFYIVGPLLFCYIFLRIKKVVP